MICKEFDELTPQEKTTYIGQLVHSVQSDSELFKTGQMLISVAKKKGLFDNVIINPQTHDPDTNSISA